MKLFATVAVLSLTLAASSAQAMDITECFQSVPPGETGELLNDITCVDNGEDAGNVYLGVGARLNLNGHTISGGLNGVNTNASYMPNRITGPGAISGATAPGLIAGCAVQTSAPMRLKDVTLSGNACGVDRIYNHALVLDNVIISGNTRDGIASMLPSPGRGRITGTDVTITDNGGNAAVSNGKVKFTGLTVTSNDLGGLILDSRYRSKIADGTLTGNGPGGDIAAQRAPKLVTTTCDDSVDLDDGGTLGICAND